MGTKKNIKRKDHKTKKEESVKTPEKPMHTEDKNPDENQFDFGGLPDDSDLKKGIGCGG